MQEKFVDLLYNTLTGQMADGYGIPNVQDAYDIGGCCCQLYENVCEARERLRQKMMLPEGEDDPDVLLILDTMEKIQRNLAREMYNYGQEFR